MGAADLLPIVDVDDEDARPDDVAHAGAARASRRALDVAQHLHRLRMRIADADDRAVGPIAVVPATCTLAPTRTARE